MRVQDEKLVFWYRCPKYARAAPPINLWLASCRPPPSLPRSLMPLSACFIWEYRRILNLFSPHSGVTGWPAQRDRMSDEPRRCQSAVFSFQSSTSLTAPQDQRETETRENMAFKLCSIYFCQSILDDKFTASLQVSVWALLRESISRNTVKVQVNEIALRKQFLALHESRWRPTLSDVQSRINRKCQRCTNDYTLGLCNLHNAYLTKLLGCAFEKKKISHWVGSLDVYFRNTSISEQWTLISINCTEFLGKSDWRQQGRWLLLRESQDGKKINTLNASQIMCQNGSDFIMHPSQRDFH